MNKSKLGIVTRHEYLTIVRHRSFWIFLLVMPLIMGTIFAISFIGGRAGEARQDEVARELKDITVIDKSGLVREEIVRAITQTGLTDPAQESAIREEVRQGKKEALIVYPADLAKTKQYQIYVGSNDFTKNGAISAQGDLLVKQSILAGLGSNELAGLASANLASSAVNYRDGQMTAGIYEYIVPGLIAVMFYAIFLFSVGYMLSSVSDEKENRSMEMVLTYVRSRTLIIGKMLAVVGVTLTQLAFFGLLGVIIALVSQAFGNSIDLQGLELSKLVFDPLRILFGIGFLVAGFVMYAGIMTLIAALSPTAREANSFSGIFYVGAFAPFWIIMLIVSDPENPMTRFATFFPLTSTSTALIRNTVGNITPLESILALIVLVLFAVLSVTLAVRAFRLGALEFNSRISFKRLFIK